MPINVLDNIEGCEFPKDWVEKIQAISNEN